ncbi:hypothetical protein OIU84_011957 [Salix udensis]|uniref:Uncharacterized protein n=1 Tax=Salix udensis TaxID=889485 RepID=A0AAD6JEY3_9ROSI|nr:hypothetical protein OIU84_011957 [Salix udensis]
MLAQNSLSLSLSLPRLHKHNHNTKVFLILLCCRRHLGWLVRHCIASIPGSDSGFKSMQRSQSDVFTNGAGSLRSSSFRKLKTRMQNALRRGGDSREQGYLPSFNPEVLANQKRQWYQLNSKSLNHSKYKEPTSLFEHFIVAGLHPDANLEKVEDAFAREKKWESDMEKSDLLDFKSMQRRAPSFSNFGTSDTI